MCSWPPFWASVFEVKTRGITHVTFEILSKLGWNTRYTNKLLILNVMIKGWFLSSTKFTPRFHRMSLILPVLFSSQLGCKTVSWDQRRKIWIIFQWDVENSHFFGFFKKKTTSKLFFFKLLLILEAKTLFWYITTGKTLHFPGKIFISCQKQNWVWFYVSIR